jgi:hypothetical protein
LTAQPAPNVDGEFAVFIDGLGNYSRPISTKSELAQKFFDQGLRDLRLRQVNKTVFDQRARLQKQPVRLTG